MFKKRFFSVYDDFRTGLFSKLSFLFGMVLLFVYVFLKIVFLLVGEGGGGFFGLIYDLADSSFADSVIAFSIIFFGIGFVLYFLHVQFVKLAMITDDFKEELDHLEKEAEKKSKKL
ncbi:MAG: hypothetical protein QHH19_01790 [Candidatus Thermoplasmatota archaeon]|jgi:hypothetical protein|nr:hypothetical protein [Candidatus Thermoplasmatota archaeon]